MLILTLLLAQATCYSPSDCVPPQVCTTTLDRRAPGTCIDQPQETQIDPPSLQLDAGPSDDTIDASTKATKDMILKGKKIKENSEESSSSIDTTIEEPQEDPLNGTGSNQELIDAMEELRQQEKEDAKKKTEEAQKSQTITHKIFVAPVVNVINTVKKAFCWIFGCE